MTKDQIIIGTLIETINPYTNIKTIVPITYIGKYGFTVNDTFPVPFSSQDYINRARFISYPKKPNGENCSTLEEVKEYFPEYFI